MTAPENENISPMAARTEASMTPIGGKKKLMKSRTIPIVAMKTAKTN